MRLNHEVVQLRLAREMTVGAGETFNQTAQGITFDAGIGIKLYPNRWMAIRFDLRDYVLVQEEFMGGAQQALGTAGHALISDDDESRRRLIE